MKSLRLAASRVAGFSAALLICLAWAAGAGAVEKPESTGPHPGWKTYISKHFLFYYAPESSLDKPEAIQKFADRHEAVYEDICAYLGVKREKPIIFFAYDTNEAARKLIGRDAGYAAASAGIIHARVNQTPGHEMTYVLSRAINGRAPTNRVLDAGLAVFLDHSGRDHFAEARKLLEAHKLPTFAQMLEASKHASDEDWYPAAGAFVGYLCEQHGVAKLKELWGRWNQPPETFFSEFKRIYGKPVEEMEKDLRAYLALYAPKDPAQPGAVAPK